MIDWLIITAFILGGIALVILEIIFIPGTTVVGILGLMLGIYGVYLGYDTFGSVTGHFILASSLVAGVIAIAYSFRSNAWKKFTLSTSIDSKVNETLNINLTVGDLGQTVSCLKPVGKGIFNDIEYEVSSLGNFVEEKLPIKIVKIEGAKIIVELI